YPSAPVPRRFHPVHRRLAGRPADRAPPADRNVRRRRRGRGLLRRRALRIARGLSERQRRTMDLAKIILCMAALVFSMVRSVDAEETVNGPIYIVTYFDVAPSAAGQSVEIGRQYAEASRKEGGNQGFYLLQEIGRPNRLAILEAWRDKQAYEAH